MVDDELATPYQLYIPLLKEDQLSLGVLVNPEVKAFAPSYPDSSLDVLITILPELPEV